ncbi:hypothetical protein KM043_001576 [Ampulex compressa]|nr:hypothetical protein KM043_001576 [Ampulex compressa]
MKGQKRDSRKMGIKEKSRKEMRKECRQRKKVARAMHYQKRREADTTEVSSDFIKSKKGNPPDRAEVTDGDHEGKSRKAVLRMDHRAKKRVLEAKVRDMQKIKENRRKMLLKEANLKEDKIIGQLEKRLKLNKRKNKTIPKSFVSDGLDYLLDFCTKENRTSMIESEEAPHKKLEDVEFEKDFEMVMGKNEEQEGLSDEQVSTDGSMVDDRSFLLNCTFDDHTKRVKVLNESLCVEAGYDPTEETGVDNDAKRDSFSEKGLWEDIYGRKRDQAGNVVQDANKYLPPAARLVATSSRVDERISGTLRKQLKGYINRLSEYNAHTIANQIDELYTKNSRNDMNETLTTLIFEALVSPVLTPDRLVSEHMMLIAILHANVGIEVGAHFLLATVKKYDDMSKKQQDVEDKTVDNLLLMISHLYNFKIYGARLLYQILERHLMNFTEKDIELILLILRTVGFLLRRDDPLSLKGFIYALQQKANNDNAQSSRLKFMLNILLAIKNNNICKIPQYDPSHVEHLKKVLRSIIRKGNEISQLNVTLEDLLQADKRGKWWVIGSAWSGGDKDSKPTQAKEHADSMFGQKILDLARKQRMNTDTRRNIFCILMTAEDYLDAFERLHRLGLKDHQGREIINVILHCCLQEKKFNPYYAVLTQKLCAYDRKHQLTLQYTLWDKLETLDTYDAKQLNNMARFVIYLIVEKSLSLSSLKIIRFAELDAPTMKLLRQILLGVLLHDNEEACVQAFQRICASAQLQNFREGLRLFINQFLLRNIKDDTMAHEKGALLRRRAETVERMLISHGNKVVF